MRLLLSALFLLPTLNLLAQAPDSLTPRQLREDLDFVERTIIDMHPRPWHTVRHKEFRRIKDSMLSTATTAIAAPDEWRYVARLCAAIGEGHTTSYYPDGMVQQLKASGTGLFPFAIYDMSPEGLLVRGDLSDDSSLHYGDRIVAINGRPAPELYSYFTSFFGGLPAWRKQKAMQDILSLVHLSGIRGPYRIRYVQDGTEKEKTVAAVPVDRLIARVGELRKRFPSAPKPASYTFERLPDGIGLLRFNTMSTDYAAFERFLKDTFTALQAAPVKGLIVDLRRNGGGNSALGFELIRYLTDKPFRMGGGSVWKVSASYKNWFQNDSTVRQRLGGNSAWKEYMALRNGKMIRSAGDKPQAPERNPLLFKGPVCVLIGPGTFSSANMTANAIQDYQLATLIGEPTGEPANDFGEIAFFETPHGKVSFMTSSKQFVRANGDANDMNPVLPDIYVKPEAGSKEDAVLEAARKWANRQS
ncbi:MAG: hypothetical protein EOO11_09220 [Chitinophagaceae bacterium]|nr:MAG: hypothetical protein EOO11_09220 [Chitinophagaceae bacterium]